MGHHHDHNHSPPDARRVWFALGLTLAFCVGEAVVGLISGSLALLSDSGHNFGDAVALGLSGYAAWLAARPATDRSTYGYHRAAILAPLFNASTLVVTALVIAVAAIVRLSAPQAVATLPMIWTAAAACVMNAIVALWLAGGIRHSLNHRSVFVHMVGDALSSLAVVIGGMVIHYTGWRIVDPALSLGIAFYILWSAGGVLRQSVGILMENAPPELDMAALVAAIRAVEPVQSVHHLHVWMIRDGMTALSCHVTLPEACSLKDCSATIAAINVALHGDFGIHHATIQAELEGQCEADRAEVLCRVEMHAHD